MLMYISLQTFYKNLHIYQDPVSRLLKNLPETGQMKQKKTKAKKGQTEILDYISSFGGEIHFISQKKV